MLSAKQRRQETRERRLSVLYLWHHQLCSRRYVARVRQRLRRVHRSVARALERRRVERVSVVRVVHEQRVSVPLARLKRARGGAGDQQSVCKASTPQIIDEARTHALWDETTLLAFEQEARGQARVMIRTCALNDTLCPRSGRFRLLACTSGRAVHASWVEQVVYLPQVCQEELHARSCLAFWAVWPAVEDDRITNRRRDDGVHRMRHKWDRGKHVLEKREQGVRLRADSLL